MRKNLDLLFRTNRLTDNSKDQPQISLSTWREQDWFNPSEDFDKFSKISGLVPCSVDIYARWLLIFLSSYGKITHSRKYNFEHEATDWQIMQRPVASLLPNTAQPLRIVMPPGVSVIEDAGTPHHILKWFRDPRTKRWVATTNRPQLVESYPDVEKLILRNRRVA